MLLKTLIVNWVVPWEQLRDLGLATIQEEVCYHSERENMNQHQNLHDDRKRQETMKKKRYGLCVHITLLCNNLYVFNGFINTLYAIICEYQTIL